MSESGTEEKKTEAQSDLEDLRDLIDYLVSDYTYTMDAVSNLPKELVFFANNLTAELSNSDRQLIVIELSKVHALNTLLLEAVKTNRDHGFFINRDNARQYFRIMSKLGTVRKFLIRKERLDNSINVDQIVELTKAVQEDLKALIFSVMDYINDCPDYNDYEEPDDDEEEEPEEPEEDSGEY